MSRSETEDCMRHLSRTNDTSLGPVGRLSGPKRLGSFAPFALRLPSAPAFVPFKDSLPFRSLAFLSFSAGIFKLQIAP